MRKSKNEILIEALQEGPVEVTFTKLNGETRIMDCTLNFDYLPLEDQPSGVNPVIEDAKKTVLPVFDVDLQEWRSFLFDNVKDWRKI